MTDTKAQQTAMFDLGAKDPEKEKKEKVKAKQEEAKKKAEEEKKERERKKEEEENRVHPEGTEVKYVSHVGRDSVKLPRDMKKKEIFEYLQEDYPEVSETRMQYRFDEERQRVVIMAGAMTKG